MSVNFFPGLIAHQSGVSKAGQGNDMSDTSTNNYKGLPSHAALALSGYKGGDIMGSYANGYALFTQAGPFCGGMGYNRSHGNSGKCSAQSGGVGGGGGGCQSQTGSGTATSGAGGSGLVMIFPLDMG